jgi:predicted PolB exonuclease-like 3'-5' exonuclease
VFELLVARGAEGKLVAPRFEAEKIGQLRPQLITWNGHSFDLPVLRHRAMVNRISAAGLHVRQYFHRDTDDALDLCDILGSYARGAKAKLDEVSKILGLTGKPEGIDGSKVGEMVAVGQIDEVARYCKSDVLNTFPVWLVYESFRGAITEAQLEWSEAQFGILWRSGIRAIRIYWRRWNGDKFPPARLRVERNGRAVGRRC